jgi:DNA-binding response OmpR family regulator
VLDEDERRPTDQSTRAARIVIIDDQIDVVDTIALVLRADGHDVRAFTDPNPAVASAIGDPPDLVITDLGMPGMNGWDVARAIRAVVPGMPVVLLTGWGREISAAQARDGGIAAVIPKPVEGPELRRAVASALARDTGPLRVLVVDDSAAFAAVLAMLIDQAGHNTTRVETAAAAVHALHGEVYDLILLDANLAAGDAARVAAAVRAVTPPPVLCVVSGSDVPTMERLVPGADLYVEKIRVPERLDDIVGIARTRANGV